MPYPPPPLPTADLLRPATSVAGLRRLQQTLASLAAPVPVDGALPLPHALGRVLARPHGVVSSGVPALPAGLRLEPRHLALLATARPATVTVFARPRVGIVALHTAGAEPGPSAASAAALAGAVESIGAQAFQAGCADACPTALLRTVRMLAPECELVLIAGRLGAPHADALLQALCDPAAAGPHALQQACAPGLAALQLARLGGTLTMALGSDPCAAVAGFATLAAPVLRRLQGRHELLPPLRHASLAEALAADAGGAPWLVQEAGDAAGLRLRMCPDEGGAARRLAMADGIAWRPPAPDADPRGTRGAPLAYFAFRTALA